MDTITLTVRDLELVKDFLEVQDHILEEQGEEAAELREALAKLLKALK